MEGFGDSIISFLTKSTIEEKRERNVVILLYHCSYLPRNSGKGSKRREEVKIITLEER